MRNTFVYITALYLLVNIILRYLLLNSEGGNGLGYLIITPIFWIFYFLVSSIVLISFREKNENNRKSSISYFRIFILLNVVITVIFLIGLIMI